MNAATEAKKEIKFLEDFIAKNPNHWSVDTKKAHLEKVRERLRSAVGKEPHFELIC